MKLTELKKGDNAVITAVDSSGEIGMRLIEMGLVRGSNIRFIRKAPLGDPVEIQIRGFCLALRKIEAGRIDVEVTGAAGGERPAGTGSGCKRIRGGGHEK